MTPIFQVYQWCYLYCSEHIFSVTIKLIKESKLLSLLTKSLVLRGLRIWPRFLFSLFLQHKITRGGSLDKRFYSWVIIVSSQNEIHIEKKRLRCGAQALCFDECKDWRKKSLENTKLSATGEIPTLCVFSQFCCGFTFMPGNLCLLFYRQHSRVFFRPRLCF